jgi:hypothetical protein
MQKYLIATALLAAASTPALAASQHYVVQDSSGYCAVLDARPSKIPSLKVIGNPKGYDSRDAAEQALKSQSHCTT